MILSTIISFLFISNSVFAEQEYSVKFYTESENNFSEYIPNNIVNAVKSNYENMADYAKILGTEFGLKSEDYINVRLGEPFYIYSTDNDKQNRIYYFPILNSDNSFILTITAIDTNHNCQLSLSDEMADFLNKIDYYNNDCIFYNYNENIIAESEKIKEYLYNPEFEFFSEENTKSTASDFDEKYAKYIEAADKLETVNVDKNIPEYTVDKYSPEFSEVVDGPNEIERQLKLYNQQWQVMNGLCWAASVATIVNYMQGTNVTAMQVSDKMGIPYKNGTNIDGEQKALALYGINFSNKSNNTLKYNRIFTNIVNKKPLIMSCSTADNQYGHAVTLVGCRNYKSNEYITLWDPALNNQKGGSKIIRFYEDNVTFNSGSTTFIWQRTVSYYG